MGKDFRHYRALAEQLARHVDAGTREAILAGMDTISRATGAEDCCMVTTYR